MTNVAELLRLLNNIVRLGTIAEVDVSRARARVKTGNNTTDWRPWQTARAGTTLEWDPPTVGEQVVLLSPAGDLSQAIIFTGLFTNNAPADSADLWRRVFPDGTTITYDHAEKNLVADFVGKANLNITGDATVNIGGSATIAVGGVCKVDAKKIHHNGGTGVVTTQHICHFTGNPHGHGSSTVTAGK